MYVSGFIYSIHYGGMKGQDVVTWEDKMVIRDSHSTYAADNNADTSKYTQAYTQNRSVWIYFLLYVKQLKNLIVSRNKIGKTPSV